MFESGWSVTNTWKRQSVEPEGVLIGAGRALLVGVRVNKGGVQVDHQQPIHPRASLPGPPAGLRPGQPQPGQVAGFVERYNSSWLIHRHGYLTPKEAHQAAQATAAA
jgi:hypothetical protein